jgi:hypothetical protein
MPTNRRSLRSWTKACPAKGTVKNRKRAQCGVRDDTAGHEPDQLEIDRVLGLESPAGRNTAILKAALHIAEVEAVLASEAFPGK